MKIINVLIEYLKYVLSGIVPLLIVYLYDNGMRISYSYVTTNVSHLHITLNLTMIDLYFLMNCLIVIPLVRYSHSHLYRKDKVEFETYKDKALRLHHSDIQSNHKERTWSPNGVTSNPWEFMYSQTQSYKNISDSSFNYFKNLMINLTIILFGPIVLCYFDAQKMIFMLRRDKHD
ncbi:hypothetical protein [Lentilactobacillus kisonensis]|uniref:Uncharacterized protein n=2 Tax=Lentilactobacillus kisonensis TaxID=481722 RepID=H1LJU5_9LACO|nr:hypothetical protein [Lentilactobacillus kisonensis]EHO48262.1 hypothetical protein HMPREF9104_02887 [Lentilactobacillus kisonensis F0435]KRL20099.1 hypothetical protein FC98_GL001891 [Lentilactobacillus kisonensis DSM 19906 = JCM 15041]